MGAIAYDNRPSGIETTSVMPLLKILAALLVLAVGIALVLRTGALTSFPLHPEDTMTEPSRADRVNAWLQEHLPQHALSGFMHRLTRITWRPFKNTLIRGFARLYDVDLTEAVSTDPDHYRDFNAFFTRALREDARPLAPGETVIASPVDGLIGQIGAIQGTSLIQAKGRDFSLLELLGGDAALTTTFAGGNYAVIYLSPRDYHRIHMPLAGTLLRTGYIPGRLFSVNEATVRAVPNLYARNERLITLFDTGGGPMAVVLVGAIFVGSMQTVWSGVVTPPYGDAPDWRRFGEDEVRLARGAEMGRFNMGSTVILLLPAGRTAWDAGATAGTFLQMGQALGRVTRIE